MLLALVPVHAQTAAGGAPAGTPSRLTVDDQTEAAAHPMPNSTVPTLALTLRGARFERLQGLATERLRPAYEDYLGKIEPGTDLCAIRDAATATVGIRALLAIQIPAQEGGTGVVRFDVGMARIVRIELTGRTARASRRLVSYIDRLSAEPMFNAHAFKRSLLIKLKGSDDYA